MKSPAVRFPISGVCGELIPARPQQFADEMVILDKFMRAETAVTVRAGRLVQPSRAFLKNRPLFASVLHVPADVVMPVVQCDLAAGRPRQGLRAA